MMLTTSQQSKESLILSLVYRSVKYGINLIFRRELSAIGVP